MDNKFHVIIKLDLKVKILIVCTNQLSKGMEERVYKTSGNITICNCLLPYCKLC